MTTYVVIVVVLDEREVLAVHGAHDTFDAAMARAKELADEYAADASEVANENEAEGGTYAATVEAWHGGSRGYCVDDEMAFLVRELSA